VPGFQPPPPTAERHRLMTFPESTPPGVSTDSEAGTGKPEAGSFPNDRRKRNIPIATDRRRAQNAAEKRKNSERRRLIDPTTCERDYNDDETEFMKAMDRYKRENRRPFPAWTEVLEVLHSLGYSQIAEATALPGGKREPIAASAPIAIYSQSPANPSDASGSASTAPEPGPTNMPLNRRKRDIPVATDHRHSRKPSAEETEFMGAMDRYKRQNRRPFPTWSEVLEVLRSLGYRRVVEMNGVAPVVNQDTGLETTPAPTTTPIPVPEPAANG
jgi:hypothetical protein